MRKGVKNTVWTEKLARGYRIRYWNPEKPEAISPDGEYVDTFEEMQAKKLELQQRVRALHKGEIDPTRRPIDLLYEYVNDSEANRGEPFADATQRKKKYAIKPLVVSMNSVNDITPSRIKKHALSIENDTTRSMDLREIRAFCNWLVSHGHLKTCPFKYEENGQKKNIHIPKGSNREVKLELDEIRKLVDNASPSLRLRLLFLVLTGARSGEILKTEWKHLDLINATWVIPAENCKTRQERTIPLDPMLVKELLRYKQLQTPTRDLVHPKHNLNSRLHALVSKCGITKNVTPHVFRHSYASHWKGHPDIAMDLLGWKSEEMRRRYTHFHVEDLRREASTRGISSNLLSSPDVQP